MTLDDELNSLVPREHVAIAEALEPLATDESAPVGARYFAELIREACADAAEADQRWRHHGPEGEHADA